MKVKERLQMEATERRRGEAAQATLAAIVESTDDGIIGQSLGGMIGSWNRGAEKIYGYSASEVIGKPISILFTSGRHKGALDVIERIKRGEPTVRLEAFHRTKDGKTIRVGLTISPIRDGAERLVGVSTIARDITERKRLEQMKGEFVSVVSHELKTPLTIIREGIAQVMDGLLGEVSEQQKRSLTMSLRGIDRLTRTINDLLDISMIEAGKLDIKREPVDLVGVVSDVTATFQNRAKSQGVELRTRFSKDAIELSGDRDRLTQVFTNLVGNALKFTATGHVEISVSDLDGAVECTVSDTGRGIAESDLPKVFEKFQRFGEPVNPKEKGTGLGLSICRGIVELHGGNIRVESQLNRGSRFVFTLKRFLQDEVLKKVAA